MSDEVNVFLNYLHELNDFDEIIDYGKQISIDDYDYDLVCHLARAYNNRFVFKSENKKDLITALELLISVKNQGKKDSLWHFRIGFSFFYLNEFSKALDCFEKANLLNPYDESTKLFMTLCLDNCSNPQ